MNVIQGIDGIIVTDETGKKFIESTIRYSDRHVNGKSYMMNFVSDPSMLRNIAANLNEVADKFDKDFGADEYKNKQASTKKSTPKPNVVEVIRYFREYDSFYGQLSSRGGMTALCELDYKKKIITVYPAFCSDEDNFSRELGTKMAHLHRDQNLGFIVPLKPNTSISGNIFGNAALVHWLSDASRRKFENLLDHYSSIMY